MCKKENENFDFKSDLVLPDFKKLESHIEKFRYKLTDVENKTKFLNDKEYFNNISILGGRGTGKTSLLIELAERLKTNEENIVFKLITPETINKEEDLLGWVISLLVKESYKIEESLRKEEDGYRYNEQDECCNVPRLTEVRKCINELQTSYFLRRETYNSIIVNDYSNKLDYVNQKSEKLNADVLLQVKFKNLVECIIKYHKKKFKKNKPLLIFMFDDVDIFSSRVCEVLNIIIRYFSHPNIVTYIAGDYNGFVENITIEFLKEEGLLNLDLLKLKLSTNNLDIREVRKLRTYEFLKKVLPPANRYYIPSLSNENKYKIIEEYLFKYISEETNFNELREELKKYIFNDKEIIYDYLEFLDDTIRGLINVINFIKNEKVNLQSNKSKLEYLSKLLNVIIESSINFEENKDLISKIFNIPNKSEENISSLRFEGYINYSVILEKINKYDKDNVISFGKDENIIYNEETLSSNEFNVLYKIFILCNFFEMIIICFKLRNNKKLHGSEELVEILNSINNNTEIFPKLAEVKEIVFIKQKMFEKLRYQEIQQLFKKESSQYLQGIYLDTFRYFNIKKSEKKLSESLKYIFNEDRQWVSKQVEWIYGALFNENTIINKIFKDLKNQYQYIDRIIDLDKIKHTILNCEDIPVIRMETNNQNSFTLIDIFNFINISYDYDKERKILFEVKNKQKNLEDIIKTLESEMENYTLKICKEKINKLNNKIDFLINNLKNFIDLKSNLEIWNSIKTDLKILKGKLIKRNNKTKQLSLMDEFLNSNYIFIDFNKEANNDEFKNLDLDLQKEEYSIYFQAPHIMANDEMRQFIKKYYFSIIMIEKLQNHKIKKYFECIDKLNKTKKELDRIKKEINIRNSYITRQLSNMKNLNIETNVKDGKYEVNIKKLTENINRLIYTGINLANDRLDKIIYLEILLKEFHNSIDREIYVSNKILISNIKNIIELEENFETRRNLENMIQSKLLTKFELNNIIYILGNEEYDNTYTKKIINNKLHRNLVVSHKINAEKANIMKQLKNEEERQSSEIFNVKKIICENGLNVISEMYIRYKMKEELEKGKEKTINNYLKKIVEEFDKFKETQSINAFKNYLKDFK